MLSLLYMLPMVYQIRGDLKKTVYYLSKIIGYEVELKLQSNAIVVAVEDMVLIPGKARLGINSILGSEFNSCEPMFQIQINDVKKEEIPTFFENGTNLTILNYILLYLMPSNANYKISISLCLSDRDFKLSDKNFTSFLSYTSYI